MSFPEAYGRLISKLPIRQFTGRLHYRVYDNFSKLPIRQFTRISIGCKVTLVSKLPIRQFTF